RGWVTRTVGGTDAPGGSVRKTTDGLRPVSRPRRKVYETVTSGFGPGTTVRAEGSWPGEETGWPSTVASAYTATCQGPGSSGGRVKVYRPWRAYSVSWTVSTSADGASGPVGREPARAPAGGGRA